MFGHELPAGTKAIMAILLIIGIAHVATASLLIHGARKVVAKKDNLFIDLNFSRKFLA